MNSNEKWLLDMIKSYSLMQNDVDRLRVRLESETYGMTQNYDAVGVSSGGYGGSKVETLAIRRMELEREIESKERVLRAIDMAIKHAGLNKLERDLIDHIIRGNSLSSFARLKHIYKSHIYKIRDRAVRKMAEYIRNHSK